MDGDRETIVLLAKEIAEMRSDKEEIKKAMELVQEQNRSLTTENEQLQKLLTAALAAADGDTEEGEEEDDVVAVVRPWKTHRRVSRHPVEVVRRRRVVASAPAPVVQAPGVQAPVVQGPAARAPLPLPPWEVEAKSRALLKAAEEGRVHDVRRLLNEGADVTFSPGPSNNSALHIAVLEGHLEVVSALISAGAPLNACDRRGHTPLHLAAIKDRRAVLSLLIDAGADIDVRDIVGSTALYKAALNGHSACVEALAAAGSNANARDSNGETPLHRAAIYGHEECVRVLLNAGANVHLRDSWGKTARDIARNPHIHALLS